MHTKIRKEAQTLEGGKKTRTLEHCNMELRGLTTKNIKKEEFENNKQTFWVLLKPKRTRSQNWSYNNNSNCMWA